MFKRVVMLFSSLFILANCGKGTPSFSLLSDAQSFKQDPSTVNTKIDILWVIDNSGSMGTSQSNLASNFQAFIQDFQDKGFDYKMAVTTTEAYKALFGGNEADYAQFKDGTDATSHTGVFVITPDTPNLTSTFITNILQGTSGSGDERAFHSMSTALSSNLNSGFLRDDSFLAVIIVSDENDFSHDNSYYTENPSNLHDVQDYIDYLDTLTSSNPITRRYNVSAMAIFDEACRQQLNDSWPGRKIGTRYEELADATSGIKGSLCGDFASNLSTIADNILQLASQFYLSRIPVPETIKVYVNNQEAPQVFDPNNPTDGWYYNATSNSIIFYGSWIPPQGADIFVSFDPVSVGQ